MPLRAHQRANNHVAEVPLDDERIGDELILYRHDICPETASYWPGKA
jgi:hypothetical protein